MQQKDTVNSPPIADISTLPTGGRILALDPGTVRIGVAICDALRVTTRPLMVLTRTSWKRLLESVKNIVGEYDAVALVIGLPLESDGSESPMSVYSRDIARKFELSLGIPVFLQDERVTSYEAKGRLWAQGLTPKEARKLIDAEAASIILADFLDKIGGSSDQ